MVLSNNFERLYCDSEIVWKQLVKQNIINDETIVHTRSLSLKKKNIKSVYLDKRISPKKREKFKNSIFLTEKRLDKIFVKSKKFEKYSIIFLQVLNLFQSNILDAIILENDFNFMGKTLISIPKTDNKFLDTFLFPSFYHLLKDKNNIKIINVDINFDNHRASTGDTRARIFQKIYIGGISSILWWVASRGFLPRFSLKNITIGVIGQSELLKSTVSAFIKAGFKIIFFKPRINERTKSKKIKKLCSEMIRLSDKELVNRFSLIKCEPLRKKSKLLFKNNLIDEIEKYHRLYEWWDKELLNHKNMKFILSGYLKGAFSMALSHAAKKHKIKIVSFQHGVTREIVETKGERSVFYETTFCDYFFSFNKKSSYITEKFKHSGSRAKIFEAGPLQEFQNLRRTDLKMKEILYVSTNLYSGNHPNTVPSCDDYTLALWETKLVKNIFSKLNKKVYFKPYPAIRYLDIDPVICEINKHKNINLVGTHTDLRFIVKNYKLIITSRATSTFSWIVASKRPVIFINNFYHSRLDKQTFLDFSEAFFVFDEREKNFHKNLFNFISKPIEHIQKAWDKKYIKRKYVSENYFGKDKKDVGKFIFKKLTNEEKINLK